MAVTVEDNGLSVPLGVSTKASALTKDNFLLFTHAATPVEILDPFRPIQVVDDYNSLTTTVRLFFDKALTPNTSYNLRITGLLSPTGRVIGDWEEPFVTPAIAPAFSDEPPEPDPVVVEDHSIISDIYTNLDLIAAGNAEFFVKKIDPDEPFIEATQNDGRVTITFSDPPLSSYVNSTFFKAQRKEISRSLTKWTAVTAQISQSGSNVYIDFPSIEATPVYHTAGKNYFAEGFKYRVRVSNNVGMNDAATPSLANAVLDEEKVFTFMVGLNPIFIDYEQMLTYFPDAGPVEILELIYNYSVEAQELTDLVDPTPLMREYVTASVACALSRIWDLGAGSSQTMTLGDLTITKQGGKATAGTLTRYTATSWCELAGVLRDELLRGSGKSGLKAIVKGANVICPMPSRRLKSQEWRRWHDN